MTSTAAEPDAVPTEAPQAIPSSEEMEEMCYENAPDDQPMEGIKEGHNNDVLCGRGVTTNRHPGNERFRALVSANKELYVSSTKRHKMAISRSIVEAVRAREPAGRFLEKDSETELWYDIGDKKAIEKTSQALRDGAATLRRQISDDVSKPSFLEAVFDGDHSSKADEEKSDAPETLKGGHRRTNSSPAVTGRTVSPPPISTSSPTKEVRASDVESQKKALDKMTKSSAGAAAMPFRPDRRPTARLHHKRSSSGGSAPIGQLFARESSSGCHYPRQTPPTSPNPYMRPSQTSPYGYHHSQYHYHYPPTPTSPGYGGYHNQCSYSWNDNQDRHHPPHHSPHHQSPNRYSGYNQGPPSPSYAIRRSPPSYHHSPGGKSYHQGTHPSSSSRSYHPYQQSHHSYRGEFQNQAYQPASPSRGVQHPGNPNPRQIDPGNDGNSENTAIPLSIPNLSMENQNRSPKPKESSLPPRSPKFQNKVVAGERPCHIAGLKTDSSHISWPNADEGPSSSDTRHYIHPRGMPAPDRISSGDSYNRVKGSGLAAEIPVQQHPNYNRVETSPVRKVTHEGSINEAEIRSDKSLFENIHRKSFTFVDGRLMENDSFVPKPTSAPMKENPIRLTPSPSAGPDTPKSVKAVDEIQRSRSQTASKNQTFEKDRPSNKVITNKVTSTFGSGHDESTALTDLNGEDVEMLAFADARFSPLPFEDTVMSNVSDPLDDLQQLFSPPEAL